MPLRASRRKIEESHWWYVGRRLIIDMLISGFPSGPALNIGCGYCGPSFNDNTLHMAVDIDLATLQNTRAKGGIFPVLADAEELPFPDNFFYRAFLLDVIEHIRNDWLALAEAHRVLVPGGYALVTAPAFASLWSAHDESEMHLRRYSRSEFQKLCRDTGFEIVKSGYFNTILFPIAAAWRLLSRRFYRSRSSRDDFLMPPRGINRLLAAVFGAERRALSLMPMPFGLSLFVILKKP